MSSSDLSELLSLVIKPRSCSWIYSTAHFLHFLPTMSSTVLQTSFLKLNNQNLQNRVRVLFNMKPKWATESINSPANLSGLRDIFPYTPIEYSHSQTALNTIWQPAASSGCRRLMAVAVKIGKQACDPVQSPVTGKSVFPLLAKPSVSLVATAVTVWMEVKDFSPRTFSEIFGCTAWAKLLL